MLPLRRAVVDATCSNWKTMSTSRRAGSVKSRASSTVTPGISPTVRKTRPRPSKTSRCISARNSWIRGPLTKAAEPSASPSRPCRRGREGRPSGRAGILGDEVDDVHPEAVDPAVEPPSHHRVHGLADLRVLPVEVGLADREQVQVVLPGRLVERPGRAREERPPVRGLGAGPPGLEPGPRRAPPVPVAFRVVPGRAGRREPRVRGRGVVDDEVEDEPHAPLVQAGDERVDLRERPEERVDVW